MGVYTPAVRTNKKHQSQRLWCKHLYALHTAGQESRQSVGTDALTLRFAHSQCRFCVGDSHPVPLCRLSPTVFRMPIFTSHMIMNLFAEFVKPFTQKKQKRKHCFPVLKIPLKALALSPKCAIIYFTPKRRSTKKQKVIL